MRSLRHAPAVGFLLLAGTIPAAFPAERVLLTDGRELSSTARRQVDGAWALTLVDGGEVQIPFDRVVRFETLTEPEPEPPAVAGPAFGAPEPADLASLIERIARENDVDPKLVEAVAWVESRHDRFAVSPKGAAGVMQLMPATARELEVIDVFDLEQNVRGGVRLLKRLSENLHGDLALVLAAYNAGEGAVTRHGGIPPYRETRNYVVAVLDRYVAALRRPEPAPTGY